MTDAPVRRNPFPIGVPAWEGSDFLGRVAELRELREAVADRAVRLVLLKGPRRIGKTSLLERFRRELESTPDNVLPIYADARLLIEEKDWGITREDATTQVLAGLAQRFAASAGIHIDTGGPLRPQDFGSRILATIDQVRPNRRIVVLMDEVESIRDRAPDAVADLIDAFERSPGSQPPLLVLSWGRPLGEVPAPRLTERLKASKTLDVGPFTVHETERVARDARVDYHFDTDALDFIWWLTRGHPFYVMAIHHVIYRNLILEEAPAHVTPEIVWQHVEPAFRVIDEGLRHAWGQLSETQSVLARGIAELTHVDRPSDDPLPTVTLSGVRSHLQGRRDRERFELSELREAAHGLVANLVLDAHDERLRIRAPFLGSWLLAYEQDQLLAMLGGDHSEANRLYESARAERERGESRAALMTVRRALTRNSRHVGAHILASELEAALGNLDSAIRHLRWAERDDPETVKGDLLLLLRRKLLVVRASGEDPRTWFYEIREVDPVAAAAPEIADALSGYYLARWKREMEDGSPDRGADVLRNLAMDAPAGWRRSAAETYAEYMAGFAASSERLGRSIVALREAFSIITSEPVAADVNEDETLRMLSERFAERPDVLSQIHQVFAERGARPKWWVVTIEALDRILAHRHFPGVDILPVQTLHDLLLRAPTSVRKGLLDCYRRHLPDRAGELLTSAPGAARELIHVLLEQPDDETVTKVVDILVKHVMHLETAGDEAVVAFFEVGAACYGDVADAIAQCGKADLVDDLVTSVEFLVLRVKHPKIADEGGDAQWTLVRRAWPAHEGWQAFLGHHALQGRATIPSLRAALEVGQAVARRARRDRLGADAAWPEELAEHFAASELESVQALDVDVPNVPPGVVRVHRARWRGTPVQVKSYRLVGFRNPETARFLERLWENERRVLFNVGTRRRGRALTQLKSSRRIVSETDELDGSLIIITEDLGTRTLRVVLDAGRAGLLAPAARAALWNEIYALIEAVESLHAAGFMHRSIRPENVYVVERDGITRFKLANFEWSVYLHNLFDQLPDRSRRLDRYTAPEVLAGIHRPSDDLPAGENFGSDTYGLGLVLFELLVRRLTRTELRHLDQNGAYDRRSHCDWIEKISNEVRERLEDPDEAGLLLSLLHPDLDHRPDHLADLAEIARRRALGLSDLHSRLRDGPPPRLVVSLDPGRPKSIGRYLPDWIDTSELEESTAALRTLLAEELAGARIHRNAGNPERPLLILGKRITFAARLFESQLGARPEDMPYFTVARTGDRPTGPEIARLPDVVELVDLPDAPAAPAAQGSFCSVWRDIFTLAQVPEERLPTELRDLHTLLAITAEVEVSLWQAEVVPYRVVGEAARADPRSVWIEADPETDAPAPASLAAIVAGYIGRDVTEFELGRNQSPIAAIDRSRLWTVASIDSQSGRVRLVRGAEESQVGEPAPNTGYLRPLSLQGNRAIRNRRLGVLRDLEDDAFLLTAIAETRAVQVQDHLGAISFFNPSLDADKQKIVKEVMRNRPLFLVQGPPGTGKTTLAAEIVQQELKRNPSARILIVSQAHAPLNNLLTRVEAAFEETQSAERVAASRAERRKQRESWRWERPMAVRLAAQERRTAVADGDEMVRIEEEFHPARVARRRLEQSLEWRPPTGSRLSAGLVREWAKFVEGQAARLTVALQDRMVRSANLVYVTANSGALANLPEDQTFDLLIFEEAAKAYPLEILGPMRLARKWLLIGDHGQLPPFDIDNFRKRLASHVREATDSAAGFARPAARVGHRKPPALRLPESRRTQAADMCEFFAWLFKRGIDGNNLQNDGDTRFAGRLTLQWRMHPAIGSLMRFAFYDFLQNGDPEHLGKTRTHPVTQPAEWVEKNLVWVDTPHASELDIAGELSGAGRGFWNAFEGRVLLELLKRIRTKGAGFKGNVAVLSPYHAQVRRLNQWFRTWGPPASLVTGDLRNVAVTVDSAQGREWNAVIVSLVRNNTADSDLDALGFLVAPERIGVMMSRARSLLVVIGSSRHFTRRQTWLGRVFQFISSHERGIVIPGKDLLRDTDIASLSQLHSRTISRFRGSQ